MAVGWKPKATPELVDKIYDVVNLQFLDMRRALYGNGNYRIAPKFSAYVIPELTSRQKSDEQKRMLFKNFLKDSKKRCHAETIVSSDGKFSVPNKARKIATKPGQRKRGLNERAIPKR